MRSFTIKVSVTETGGDKLERDLFVSVPESVAVAATLAGYLEQAAFLILAKMFQGAPGTGPVISTERGILATVGDDWP